MRRPLHNNSVYASEAKSMEPMFKSQGVAKQLASKRKHGHEDKSDRIFVGWLCYDARKPKPAQEARHTSSKPPLSA
eukprot:2159937-Amphidinium_carterae.1